MTGRQRVSDITLSVRWGAGDAGAVTLLMGGVRTVRIACDSRRFMKWRVCLKYQEFEARLDYAGREDADDLTTVRVTIQPVSQIRLVLAPWWERLAYRLAWVWS